MPDTAPPNGWKALPLGALGQFFRGRGGTKADQDPNGLPCIRYGDLYTHHGEVVRTFHSFISPSSVRQYTPLQSGDVVFAGSGETAEEIARATAYCGTGQAYAGADTVIFRPSPALLPRFAGYAVNHDSANAFKSSRAQGSSVFHISPANLSHLPFLLPPLHEQESIAAVLKTVDEAIEHTEALIAKARQIKAGLMHDLFTRGVLPNGELRPPRGEAPDLYKESEIGWIPAEWNTRIVDATCSNIVDCPHSTPNYLPQGIPCLRTADLLPGELLLESAFKVSEATYLDRVERLIPRRGDVIYSREGERLGIAAPVGDERLCLGQRVMLLRPGPETAPSFLMWAMNSPTFYRRITSGIGATTSPHVNIADIRVASVPFPTLSEQIVIGQLLDATLSQLRDEELYAKKLRHLKRGLMHDLLTGRVRVPPSLLDGASRV